MMFIVFSSCSCGFAGLAIFFFKSGKIKSAGYKLIVYPVHKGLRIAHSSEINNAEPTLW
jgi:hypothetical protein